MATSPLETSNSEQMTELFKGFSKLSRSERLKRLYTMGALNTEDMKFLTAGTPMKMDLAEKFIENVIGYFKLPMGVAANFIINGKAYAIPMAVEETSIIAAASKTAKWILEHGKIIAETIGDSIIGQIQMTQVKDFAKTEAQILEMKKRFIEMANEDVTKKMVERGGGVKDLVVRHVDRGDGKSMLVVHIHANPCEAMGANMVNQVCEYLKPHIEKATGEKVTMCILSNLVDTKITRAKVVLRGLDHEITHKIVEASLFAQKDPYRACTNNKGVLNGIDPILIATGNDWRAVEAGIHAYAARDGQYRSITRWTQQGEELHGVFEAPVILGIVGGVTALHPVSKLSLRMMDIQSAEELSQVCASVGLVQNLGALRALTSVGIIEGHMKLHIKNLTLGAGANEKEIPIVQKKLEQVLAMTKRISMRHAIEALADLRKQMRHLPSKPKDLQPPKPTQAGPTQGLQAQPNDSQPIEVKKDLQKKTTTTKTTTTGVQPLKVILSAPSKTFLTGEYGVLAKGGQSLVVNTYPLFELHIAPKGNRACWGIHKKSPAGTWIQNNPNDFEDIGITFVDPHQGRGGFGASTAQFLMVYTWTQLKKKAFDLSPTSPFTYNLEAMNLSTEDKTPLSPRSPLSSDLLGENSPQFSSLDFSSLVHMEPLWNDYRKIAWSGKGARPSGADLLGQHLGGVSFFSSHPFVSKALQWPFPHHGFFIVSTGYKLATHKHLKTKMEDEFATLKPLSEIVIRTFKEKNWFDFISSQEEFYGALNKMELTEFRAKALIEQIKDHGAIDFVKPCGALGLEVIMVFFENANRENVKSQLKNLNLNIISSERQVSLKGLTSSRGATHV